jgi:hypothetical protein
MTNFATGQDVIPAPYRSLNGVGVRRQRVDDSVLLRRLIIYKIQFALRSSFAIAGFIAFNMLAVLGAFVVFFVVLGQARPAGFFVKCHEGFLKPLVNAKLIFLWFSPSCF